MSSTPFTVITPTGDRPEAFRLCCKYVKRQTVQPTEWIVIDDGIHKTKASLPSYAKYIRRENMNKHKHSLPPQMIEAFKHVTTDIVIIIEDDDWYASNYCEYMLSLLHGIQLAGIGQTVYYNVPERRYFQHDNNKHAAWCNTAFRTSLIPKIVKICQNCYRTGYPYIDLRCWRLISCLKKLDMSDPKITLGMKGLPGRLGTCSGHRNTTPFKQDTEDVPYLRSRVGDDVDLYIPFFRSVKHTANEVDMINEEKVIPISVVTLVNKPHIYDHCVRKSLKGEGMEFVPIFNPVSAAKGLNEGIRKSSHNIIVMCHQDVLFSVEWHKKMLRQLQLIGDKNFGVVGTYGINIAGTDGVGNVISGRRMLLRGDLPALASYLDEHLLVIRRNSGLRFDESLGGFHMYGADLCLQAYMKDMSCYAINARVRHVSDNTGKNNPALAESVKWFVNKWQGRSPFKTYRTTCVMGIQL